MASNSDNGGRYTPATIIPYAIGVAGHYITNIAMNIVSNLVMNKIKGNPTAQNQQAGYQYKTISHAQLAQDPYVQNTSQYLPENIAAIINSESQLEYKQKTHLHFTEKNESDNQLLAQAVANKTHSSYCQFKKDALNPQLDLQNLRSMISEIAKTNKAAVVHLDFTRTELESPIYSKQMVDVQKKYSGTLSQALTIISQEHPNLRIITHSHQKNYSTKYKSDFECDKSSNITFFNNPSSKSKIDKEQVSTYIALTLKNKNEALTKNNWFSWIWSPKIEYKPSEKPFDSHLNNYLYKELNNLSSDEINTCIDSLIRNKKPRTLFEYAASFLDTKVNEIDILTAINAKKYNKFNKSLISGNQDNNPHKETSGKNHLQDVPSQETLKEKYKKTKEEYKKTMDELKKITRETEATQNQNTPIQPKSILKKIKELNGTDLS